MANFRIMKTTSGKLVLAGKDAETNEKLVKQVEDYEDVFHTAKPGSPFVNIKARKTNAEERKEAALFCASKSKDWRDNKNNVVIHYFKGKDIFKERNMKTGTFGVKNFKRIVINKGDIEKFIKDSK